MKKITKNTTIGEVLKLNKNAETILSGFGMHCFSCPFSQMETIEEAAMTHGLEANLILEKLNEKPPVEQKKIKVTKKVKK